MFLIILNFNDMKKSIQVVFIAVITAMFLLGFINLFAQDPVKVANNVYKKVLLDNEKVRVLQVEFAPGAVTAWHQHPNHVAYALTSGKLEITDKGKAPQVMEIKEGDAMYLPAVTHMAKNVGDNTVKLVVTELKPHKMAEMKKQSESK